MKKASLLLLPFFLAACGKVCSTQVQENAKIKNLTGLNLQIELCKVPFEQATGNPEDKTETRSRVAVIDIKSSQDGEMLVDSYNVDREKKSGDQCTTSEQVDFTSQVFLTTTSYSQFKLCRNDQDPTQVTIVTLASGCPTGSTAQAAAVVSCDETALVE